MKEGKNGLVKCLPIFPRNNSQGFTLLEIIVSVGILLIIVMVIILFVKGGIEFWAKGVYTEPQEIARLILEGEPGKLGLENMGLVPTIRGAYSIYGPRFDVDEPITLGTNTIILGYGIVDCGDGICNTTVTTTTDFQIINCGSPTTTNFRKGTPTITVVFPYDPQDPTGTTSHILATNPSGDDYGLAIKYQFKEIKEEKNGRIHNQGRLYKSVYTKDSRGSWTIKGTEILIVENISQLEFRYFTTSDKELPTEIPLSLNMIRQIKSIMITLKVDRDDDNDTSIEEDWIDEEKVTCSRERDNDNDGKIDEDYFNGIEIVTRVYLRNL